MIRPTHVPDGLVIEYDTFGAEQISDVQGVAQRWRDQMGEVVWTDRHGGHWLVLSAEGCRAGLTDTSMFDSSSRGVKLVGLLDERERMVPIELDGAEHSEYRRMLNPLFSPARMRLLDERVREAGRELIAKFVDNGRCEVVSEFARPLASSMFLNLVDWPIEDREKLEHWVELELNGIPGQSEQENLATQADAIAKIAAYSMKQIEDRTKNPRDDMTTLLMNTQVNGEALPPNRVIGLLMLLMIAGLDTTQSVTSQGVELLALRPHLQDQIRLHPERLPMVVEEILRWSGPAGPNRSVVRDLEFCGIEMKRGDRVTFMCPVANRDADEFADPQQIDFEREVNRHMTFGLGPHKCIGAALARTILVGAMDEFHRALPTYSLESSTSHLGGVWGMTTVNVTWEDRDQ